MAIESFQSTNFQSQFENSEFTATELPVIRTRANALLSGYEADLATLCAWFGVAVGEAFGSGNRVVVTLTKNVNGASNTGYSKNNSQMSVNASIGGTNDSVLSLFVAEMSEILMSLKGNWGPGDSGGEGLSRVTAEILHPASVVPGGGNVNAWLASDPTQDTTSAIADSEFRKNWVIENFKGGNLKAGGFVKGDDDSYSYGCSMLFIFYLKDQLHFLIQQIIQSGGKTLAETYKNLTGKNDDGFWDFKSLLSEHFPLGVQSPTDNPFPLTDVKVTTSLPAGLGASNNTSALAFIKPDNRIFYSYWDLGQAGRKFVEMDGNGRTGAAPTVTVVGNNHDYLFAVVKDNNNSLSMNQGNLGKTLVGWQNLNFQTSLPAAMGSSANTVALASVAMDGRIFYSWWKLGEAGKPFVELGGGGRTNAAPAVALVGNNHNFLFTVVKGLDNKLYLNQGGLGGPMVGWQGLNFSSPFAPAAAGAANTTVIVAVSADQRIFYSWWELGKAGSPFIELTGGGHTNAAPACALVGKNHDYLFVVVKGLDGNLYLNQGNLGKPFVGWQKVS